MANEKLVLEIGDVVQLKSGGPQMTVEGVSSDKSRVSCIWFSDESVKKDGFQTQSLQKVQ